MKKLLSIILTVCMLFSLVIVPVTVNAAGECVVNFYVDGEIDNTETGEVGANVPLYAPEASDGQYFVNWYTDDQFTTPLTAVPTFTEGAPLKLYAKFADYGGDIKLDFDDGTHLSPAVQYSSAGFVYPTRGYGYKGNSYKGTVNPTALIDELTRKGLDTEVPESSLVFFSDRTWSETGCLMLVNPDGTLYTPKAGGIYKISYRYRALVHNGNNTAINVVYGINNTVAGRETTIETTGETKPLAWHTVEEVSNDWVTITNTVTIPDASSSHVPALGLYISNAKKVAVDGGYDHTAVLIDYIEVEEIPTAKVNFLKADGSAYTTSSTLEVGEDITYPKLTASINYDYVWSRNQETYVPAPKRLEKDEDITVYAIQSPVISYENYPVSTNAAAALHGGARADDDEMNAVVSDKDAYTGSKSVRLRNYGMHWVVTEDNYTTATNNGAYKYDAATDSFVPLEEVPEFVPASVETIANGTAFAFKRPSSNETGMNVIREFDATGGTSLTFSYKITFKYKATENNSTSSTLSARLFPKGSIWWGNNPKIVGSFTFPVGQTKGWQTGEMYVAVSNFTGVNDTYTIAKYAHVLDLKFNGNATLNTNEIYIDDITIEENYVNTPKLYVHIGDQVDTITEDLTAGDTFTPPTLEAPAGKYVIGWTDAVGNDLTEFKMPAANLLGEYHIYAKFGTYPDGVTIDTTGATQPTLKGYSAFTSAILNDSGWSKRTYTDEGIKFEKSLNGADKWDPSKTDGLAQTATLNDYVALPTDLDVGKQTYGGWGASTQYILRDKDGNAIMAKPNTKYAMVVTYEKVADGEQTLRVRVGKKADYITTGETTGGENYFRFTSQDYTFNEEVTGENNTHTYYVTTGEFSEGDVPVIALNYIGGKFLVERVAEVNGVPSYTLTTNNKTYFPYRIVSASCVIVKSVQLIEIDEGNVAVTYNTYEKGVGFSATVKDNAPKASLDVDTKNFDTKWYDSETEPNVNHVVTTYPNTNATYYSAGYMQAHLSGGSSDYFGDGKQNGSDNKTIVFENKAVDVEGATKYALNVSTDEAVASNDAECFILVPHMIDGHTYKISYKYKANTNNSKFGLNFMTAGYNNIWPTMVTRYTTAVAAGTSDDTWTEQTAYFTVDLIGDVADERETGIDYKVTNDTRDTLYASFYQDINEESANDIYFVDFEVVDLGEAIQAKGASVLTDDAASRAKQQAMRFYFDYKTVDGSTIELSNGDILKVVKRGFIYRNGSADRNNDDYIDEDASVEYFTLSNALVSEEKTDNFDVCWAYNEGMMTFSTYVKGFDEFDDNKKLEVKAYIIATDTKGNTFTLYANKSINRTVDGVKGNDYDMPSDDDIDIGK